MDTIHEQCSLFIEQNTHFPSIEVKSKDKDAMGQKYQVVNEGFFVLINTFKLIKKGDQRKNLKS